eukprot:381398-Hanusia_phi.AAC.1
MQPGRTVARAAGPGAALVYSVQNADTRVSRRNLSCSEFPEAALGRLGRQGGEKVSVGLKSI